MTPQTKTYLFWTIGILVVVGLVWWGQQRSDVPQQLRVGVVIPLTGPASFAGQELLNGLKMAQADLDGNGITLFVEDSQSVPREGISAARRLLSTQEIDVLVSMQSAVVVPLLGVAQEYNVPLIATAIAKDDFTQQSHLAFRLFPPARQDAALAADFATEQGYKTVGLVTVNDEYGSSMREHFKGKFNGDVVFDEIFTVTETDFKTILLKTVDVEAVFFIGYVPNYISFYKQRAELGLSVPVISNSVMASSTVRQEVGDIMNNSFAVAPQSLLSMNDPDNEFRKRYKDLYGQEPDWPVPFGYDIMVVLKALSNSDKAPIETLQDITVVGLHGSLRFNEFREVVIPLTIVEVTREVISYDFAN